MFESIHSQRRLTAQLARVEEAAKRALMQQDPSFRQGGAAQKLLDAECAIARLRSQRAEIGHRFQRLESELDKYCMDMLGRNERKDRYCPTY